MDKSKFIDNLKENMRFVMDNYPHLLEEYRIGVRNVSLEAVNDFYGDLEVEFKQEYKACVGDE